jgi:hypothetical protein
LKAGKRRRKSRVETMTTSGAGKIRTEKSKLSERRIKRIKPLAKCGPKAARAV